MMDFLPQGYVLPDKTNGYMKLKQGNNRFRILSSPIIGWEWWVETEKGRKPVRVHMTERVPVEFADETKHFWAMPVWNYEANQVQILEITQKGIQKTLSSFANNPKWGAPFSYDISIDRSGEGLETEYVVDHDPKEELPEEIKMITDKVKVNLNALYEGKDPFSTDLSEEDEDELDEVFS